jgi:hypothetical protein
MLGKPDGRRTRCAYGCLCLCKENKIGEYQMLKNKYISYLFKVLVNVFLFSLATPVFALLDIPEGWTPNEAKLIVTDNLNKEEKELIIETSEWKVVMSLYYNGGIYKMYDKVHDPNQQDNLVTDNGYSQGGIFDYDVYLQGDQEHMTTLGRNDNPSQASLEILENTPVRVRVRQKCHPRLNNGRGPSEDKFLELGMVETVTDWTFYPTGRVNIKFDAVVPKDWNEIIAQGPGGSGKGVNFKGNIVTSANGTDFLHPWITQGDMIESKAGGWGPVQVTERVDKDTLRLESEVASGQNLDYIIKRTNILDETFSIHADGDTGEAPRKSLWQGGSDGDPLHDNGTDGDFFRNRTPPVANDYVYAHWTRSPREFGSLLVFNERFTGASYAVFNDLTYGNLSYTQVARRGWRRFQEHHRHFMAQLGTEHGKALPRIKSIADSLPYANDYKHPYTNAVIGKLQTGDDISSYGFNPVTGAYQISADNGKTVAISFDAKRGETVESPLAYYQPVILVSDLDIGNNLLVELSQDKGKTFEELPKSWYNITTSEKLGGSGKCLLQLLCPIPSSATGEKSWILRISEK